MFVVEVCYQETVCCSKSEEESTSEEVSYKAECRTVLWSLASLPPHRWARLCIQRR